MKTIIREQIINKKIIMINKMYYFDIEVCTLYRTVYIGHCWRHTDY